MQFFRILITKFTKTIFTKKLNYMNPTNLLAQLAQMNLPDDVKQKFIDEIKNSPEKHFLPKDFSEIDKDFNQKNDIYTYNDQIFLGGWQPTPNYLMSLQSLEELIAQDRQREKDGFPRRIRLGKLVKPAETKGKKNEIIIVPTTNEAKLYHDDNPNQPQEMGGVGEGETGKVIGEKPANPQQNQQQGEGEGAGEGKGGKHDVVAEAFDLGRILTEQFSLPNLQQKGKKPSLTKILYDLTDKNEGFGQLLDNKATLKKILQSNILLNPQTENLNPEDFVVNPKDKVYRIVSPEKDVDSQAMVFFLRDYSGSMQGKPTEVITTQHLFIYSWLMYQYNNQVESRFILHDTEAKEVADFYTYYKSTVAGGTNVYPAFELVDTIVTKENLAKDYNIYVFHGTDGDDWEQNGEKTLAIIQKMLTYTNRLGITIAKNAWSGTQTTVEKYIQNSGILTKMPAFVRMDSFQADISNESRMIEGIKKLVS